MAGGNGRATALDPVVLSAPAQHLTDGAAHEEDVGKNSDIPIAHVQGPGSRSSNDSNNNNNNSKDNKAKDKLENQVAVAQPAKPAAAQQSILIRLRWRLPFIIMCIVLVLIALAIAYYAMLLSHLVQEKKTDASGGVTGRIAGVVVCLILQVLSTVMFFLSFYLIVFSDPGHVPSTPWRLQPWYINRATFQGEFPLNSLDGIELYHNDYTNANMALVRASEIPADTPPELPPPPESEEEEEVFEYEYPDNYSPYYDVWRYDQLQIGVDVNAPLSEEKDKAAAGGAALARANPLSPSRSAFDIHADPNMSSQMLAASPFYSFSSWSQLPVSTVSHRPYCLFRFLDQRRVNPFFVTIKESVGSYRYCFPCHHYKPDLAIHCRVCGHCVYNFDHHCPYVDNCIGRNNYKTFVSFLFYASLATFLGFLLVLIAIVAVDDRGARWPWMAIPILSFLIFIFMCRFLIKHVRYIYRGRSTMEMIIHKRRVDTAKKNKQPVPPDPYDLLTPEEQQRKADQHREILFGPPRWGRWISVLNPFPYRTDSLPTKESPILPKPSSQPVPGQV